MGLIQLPKVIAAVNDLALKVQKLEVQVQSILNDKNNAKESKPSTAKKPT